MKVFLAGGGWEKRLWMKNDFYNFYRLHTFHDMSKHEPDVIHKYKGFLLDSGAFSFFGDAEANWDEYVTRYIAFIKKYEIKEFFELDIYALIGIPETEKIRARIEKETGRQTIPVFHKRLGIDYYKMLCEKYKYIAISASGKYESKWTKSNPETLIKLVRYANSKGVKVHGLGYTRMKMLHKVPFYSVDSSTWLAGNQFGKVYEFNGTGITTYPKPEGKRVKTDATALNNFNEWVKFQKYADEML